MHVLGIPVFHADAHLPEVASVVATDLANCVASLSKYSHLPEEKVAQIRVQALGTGLALKSGKHAAPYSRRLRPRRLRSCRV